GRGTRGVDESVYASYQKGMGRQHAAPGRRDTARQLLRTARQVQHQRSVERLGLEARQPAQGEVELEDTAAPAKAPDQLDEVGWQSALTDEIQKEPLRLDRGQDRSASGDLLGS